MFILIVELETDAARAAELETVLRALAANAEHEPGIHLYGVQRLQDNSTRFILCEYYADKAAWETHMQNAFVQEKLKRFDALLTAAPKVTRCDDVAVMK